MLDLFINNCAYLKGGLHPRDEMAIMNIRKGMEEEEGIYGRPEIEFSNNDNQLGVSRVDINFDEDNDDNDNDDEDDNK